MKLTAIKFVLLIILIFLLNCGDTSNVKNKSKTVSEASTFKIENKGNILKGVEINKTTEVSQSRVGKSFKCIFEGEENLLPRIKEVIGDTINIKNVYKLISDLNTTEEDSEIRKVVKRGDKFFQIYETKNFIAIGFLEDEGEYLGIYIHSIDKKNCKIIGEELLAEETAWENGYKETYSIIKDDFSIKKVKRTGSKDWGDHTKWARDTIVTIITFNKNGKIE